jgi:DNA repair exonuclease SbcCD ATPase subunit
MELKRARYRNWCQFRDLTIDFSPGLNLIIGPNGCGKSNSLKGVYAAITGETGRNEGKQGDNINQKAAADEPSFVELDFHHNGSVVSAMQSLRGDSSKSKRSVTINGVTTTGDKATRAEIYRILDIDEDLLSDYVMINQWELFSIFHLTPAKRAVAIQKLFRLDRAELIYSKLGDRISALPAAPLVEAVSEEVEKEIESKIVEAQLELDVASIVTDQDIESLRTRLSNAVTAHAGRADVRQIQEQIDQCTNQLASLLTHSEDIRPKLDTIISDRDHHKSSMDMMTDLERQWELYEANVRSSQQIAKQREAIQAEIDALRAPEWPSDGTVSYVTPADRPGVEKNLDRLRMEVMQAEKTLKEFDASKGLVECPTCSTPVSHLLPHLETCRIKIESLSPMIEQVSRSLKLSTTYDEQYRQYSSIRSSKTSYLERLVVVPVNDVQPPMPRPAATAMSTARETLAGIESRYQSLRAQYDTISKSLSELRGRSSQLGEQMVKANIRASLSSEDHNSLSADVDAAISAKSRRDLTLKRLEELKVQLSGIRTQRANAMAAAERYRTIEDRRQALTSLRSRFHPQAVPRVLAADMLRTVVGVANHYCREFGSPFQLSATEDGGFTVNFPDGRVVRPQRLSGGEGVVLALAFRLAINSTHASHLGLLCLDEPTVGLDSSNLTGLTRAFDRLRELASATNLQIVVVSHEKEIASKFDNVIELRPC